jgi:hypothetical protein
MLEAAMWQAGRAGGPGVKVRAGVAVIAVALLAGCGGGRVSSEPPGHPGSPARTVASSGPRGGSRAQALGLAGRLLASLALPAGSHVTNVPLAGQLRQPAGMMGIGLVDVHRLFSLGLPMRQAARFLRAHTPPGMQAGGGGQVNVATTAVRTLSYSLDSPPPGIYWAMLAETVVPAAGGRSLLRADAQITRYLSRTAAERIDPARYGAVILKAHVLFPSREVTRRVTSKAVIARLAAMLNGMYAAPIRDAPCPTGPVIYQVRFAAAARSTPSVLVATEGCLTLQVNTGGQGQPALWDSRGRFEAAVQHLPGFEHLP